MPKYRVLTKSFINNVLIDPDADGVNNIVEYEGTPGDNLEPIDPPAVKAAELSEQANLESLARQKAAAIGGDPNAVDTSAALNAAAEAAAKTLQGQGAAGLV